MKSVTNELEDLSKTLSGFENEMRLVENEHEEFARILDGRNNSVTNQAPELTCEDGWIWSPEGICYHVTPPSEQTNWATAIERCKSKGANLVEFRTDEQAEFMLQNMPNMSMTYYIYTGRKMNEQDEWVFLTDGEPVDTSLRTWARNEPDGTEPTTACGCIKTLSADFRMSDCICAGFPFQFICQKEPMAVGATPTPTPKSRDCDDGWASSLGKCYYYSEDKTNWINAKDSCETKGANLVEMKTDEEALYVMENLPSRIGPNDLVYTGRKVNDVGRWVFGSSGDAIDRAKKSWAMFEPNGEGVQNCGCTKSNGFFRMRDCHCIGFSLYYICEIMR